MVNPTGAGPGAGGDGFNAEEQTGTPASPMCWAGWQPPPCATQHPLLRAAWTRGCSGARSIPGARWELGCGSAPVQRVLGARTPRSPRGAWFPCGCLILPTTSASPPISAAIPWYKPAHISFPLSASFPFSPSLLPSVLRKLEPDDTF